MEPESKREDIDIAVLNADIQRIVEREQELRVEIDAIIRRIEGGTENE